MSASIDSRETCLTPDEWRVVLERCYPGAQPEVRPIDGALFYGLVGEADRATYRAAFFPAHSYGYVEVPR